jgi:hypothetical protein
MIFLVGIKSKAITASMSLTSLPQGSGKCFHRSQNNYTKNLVPLAEARFIFEMIQGMMLVLVFGLDAHIF